MILVKLPRAFTVIVLLRSNSEFAVKTTALSRLLPPEISLFQFCTFFHKTFRASDVTKSQSVMGYEGHRGAEQPTRMQT